MPQGYKIKTEKDNQPQPARIQAIANQVISFLASALSLHQSLPWLQSAEGS